jgi:ATP-dependent Clp protease ATP-binding subunit ClpA
MFERYTEKARRAIFFAQYEANQFRSAYIETEHLLLGLLRENKDLFRRLLPKVDYDSIRKEVEAHTHIEKWISTAPELPLSDESKRVLAYAADEAVRLNHRHIGTEHLLLGLLREKKHPAARLLHERGAEISSLRLQVGKLPEESWPPRTLRVPPRKTVEIHGTSRDAVLVYAAVARCRENSWHWHKSAWSPRDMVVDRKRASLSFDLSLAEDSANFELIKNGWKKDR